MKASTKRKPPSFGSEVQLKPILPTMTQITPSPIVRALPPGDIDLAAGGRPVRILDIVDLESRVLAAPPGDKVSQSKVVPGDGRRSERRR